MRTIGILTLSALAVILGACGSEPAVNKVAIEKSVTDVEKGMLKAANGKDAAALTSNYAADAIFMSPGMAAMKGTDAIQAGMKELLADPNFKLDFASDRVEIADSGDMAATHGSYTLIVSDPATKQPINDKGSYVTVFRKQKDGAWKAVLDINTSEVPPPVAPAPKTASKKPQSKKAKGKKR
jgi:uncharacterized protein (TIGR02246 family)